MTDTHSMNVGEYLIHRLGELGIREMFGIPGDYILKFFRMVEHSPIEMVVTTNELCAGYAADAYARINGIGAACITYAVGGFSLTNAVASAYAEMSPVVFISGSPATKRQKRNWHLHHMVGTPDTQFQVFEKLTVASCVIDDPLTAFREIDRVLSACLRYKRPVYIELPQDRLDITSPYPHNPTIETPLSDADELREALGDALGKLYSSRSPVVIAGIELHRHKLADEVLKFAEANNIPVVSTLLSKSVIRENHPLYVGVYQAAMGRKEVTEFVESSDCILMLGAMITDTDTGIFTHNLDQSRVIFATSDQISIGYHHYQDIVLSDFVRALSQKSLPAYHRPLPRIVNPIDAPWIAEADQPMTVRRLFQKINSILSSTTIVLADPGNALFGAADLSVHDSAEFLGSAFYATLGWAVPAAIGVQYAAPTHRPIVLVGDGAFQMTCCELGTTRRKGLNPIVIVLNNKGYLTEKVIFEGTFNDIPDWSYHRLPEFLGAGIGFEVRTEGELDAALTASLANADSFSILNVHLGERDHAPGLKRLGDGLAGRS